MNEPLLLHPVEAAERLSVNRTRVYGLMRSGDLPSVRLGRTRLIRASDLAVFVERLPEIPL